MVLDLNFTTIRPKKSLYEKLPKSLNPTVLQYMYLCTFDTKDAVWVHVVDPLAGALPDDVPHPQRQVRRHQVDEAKPEA